MNKSDFKVDKILKNHFKLGKLVYFIDNSYTTDINGVSARPTFDEGLGIFKIIDFNKPFPTAITKEFCCPINNMKVQNIITGKIYHCSNLNVLSINSSEIDGEPTVIYKGHQQKISKVFSNPFPFL